MIAYFLAFVASIVSCYFSEKLIQAKKKKLGVFLAIIAIAIPAIIAGLRTIDVGTDVRYYLVSDYQYALRLGDFSEYTNVAYGEPLFIGIVYAASNVFKDINVLMFLLSLITVVALYLGCVRFRKKAPVFLMYGFFLFVYFNMSLNMIRQSIALSFSFLALSYLFDKKWIGFFSLGIVSFFFHKTAIVLLVIFLLYEVFSRLKRKKIFYLMSFFGAVLFIAFFGVILEYLVNIKILDEKYLYYAQSSNVDVSLSYVGFSVLAFLTAFTKRKEVFNDENNGFLVFVSFLNIMLLGLSMRFNNAERLTYYFGYLNIVLVSMVVSLSIKMKRSEKRDALAKNRAIVILCLYFGALLGYHIVYYGLLGNHQTYPYHSVIEEKVEGNI